MRLTCGLHLLHFMHIANLVKKRKELIQERHNRLGIYFLGHAGEACMGEVVVETG